MREYVWWIIAIVIASFLVYYLVYGGDFVKSTFLGQKISEGIEKFKGWNMRIPLSTSNKCEELAEELIPKNITLWKRESPYFGYPEEWHTVEYNHWNDGSEITAPFLSSIEFYIGRSEGENVNYYYFYAGDYIQFQDNSLTYSKEIIDKDGTILGTRAFKIRPTLKPLPGSEGIYKTPITGAQYESKKFEIIEPNIVYCHWVTKDGEVIESDCKLGELCP